MRSKSMDTLSVSDDESTGRHVKKLPRKPQVKKKELQVSYKVSASTSKNTLAVSTFTHTVPVGNVNSGKRRSVTQVTTQIAAQGKCAVSDETQEVEEGERGQRGRVRPRKQRAERSCILFHFAFHLYFRILHSCPSIFPLELNLMERN